MDGINEIIDIDEWVKRFVAKHKQQSDAEFERWLDA